MYKVIFPLLLFIGCATTGMGPQGSYYNGVKVVNSSNKVSSSKIARSCSHNVLGLFAYGGETLEEMVGRSNMTTVSNIYYESFSIFSIYAKLCAVIKGD